MKTTASARLFHLVRDEDETGVSGTGLVAEGVEFTSGMVALTWLSAHRCVNVYESIRTVAEVHGHGGKTRVLWLDNAPWRCKRPGCGLPVAYLGAEYCGAACSELRKG